MDNVLKNVLKGLTPSSKEKKHLKIVVSEIKDKMSSALKKRRIKAKIVLGGSVEKGTYVTTKDIDFFVRFNSKHKRISDLLVKTVRKIFPRAQVVHGSRDYIQFKYKGHVIEMIPVLNIPVKKAENTMDISPHHAVYVKKHLKNKDQVKILKKFCKANGIYGAESYLQGFSGYVLELLIIKYKTFKNLINKVNEWGPPVFIDLKKHYKSKKQALSSLPKSKKGPLILIDPVLKKRNVAASLGYPVFSKFVHLCKQFKKKPSITFFKHKKLTKEFLKKQSKKRNTQIYFYTKKIKGRKEIFLAKLVKSLKKIKSKLEKEDFKVYDYGWFETGKTVTIYFEFSVWKVNKIKKQYGPPTWTTEVHLKRFKFRHRKTYLEKNRLVADVKRRYTTAKKLLTTLM